MGMSTHYSGSLDEMADFIGGMAKAERGRADEMLGRKGQINASKRARGHADGLEQAARIMSSWGVTGPDQRAMVAIHKALDGQRWTPETLQYIASLVRGTGRQVRDPTEKEESDGSA